jgi:hypothetical protein
MTQKARAQLCLAQGHHSEAETRRLDLIQQEFNTWSSKEPLTMKDLDVIFHIGQLAHIYNRAGAYIGAYLLLSRARKAKSKLLGP